MVHWQVVALAVYVVAQVAVMAGKLMMFILYPCRDKCYTQSLYTHARIRFLTIPTFKLSPPLSILSKDKSWLRQNLHSRRLHHMMT